jgi:hypothetical protein
MEMKKVHFIRSLPDVKELRHADLRLSPGAGFAIFCFVMAGRSW